MVLPGIFHHHTQSLPHCFHIHVFLATVFPVSKHPELTDGNSSYSYFSLIHGSVCPSATFGLRKITLYFCINVSYGVHAPPILMFITHHAKSQMNCSRSLDEYFLRRTSLDHGLNVLRNHRGLYRPWSSSFLCPSVGNITDSKEI